MAKKNSSVRTGALLLVLLVCFASSAVGAAEGSRKAAFYSFDPVAVFGPNDESVGFPDLSNDGTAAFIYIGIVTANGSGLQVVYDPGQLYLGGHGDPRVNNNGEVVFQVTDYPTGSGVGPAIVRADASGVSAVALSEAAAPGSGFAEFPKGVDINDRGTIAFRAIRADGQQGIFLAGARGIQSLVLDQGIFGEISMNSRGQVAYYSQGAAGPGVFVAGEHGIVEVDSGGFASFSGSPALNDRGQVAFFGVTSSGMQGVFRGEAGRPTRAIASISPTQDRWSQLSDSPGIDARGRVSFLGTRNDGLNLLGLYVGTGGAQRLLLREADSLETGPYGSATSVTVQNLWGGVRSMNRRGEIALLAGLDIDTDPHHAILIARPRPRPGKELVCSGFKPRPVQRLRQPELGVMALRAKLQDKTSGRTAKVRSPPVLRVLHRATPEEAPTDRSSEVRTRGQHRLGLAFRSDFRGWTSRVLIQSLKRPGFYTFEMRSGNPAEYTIDSTCTDTVEVRVAR